MKQVDDKFIAALDKLILEMPPDDKDLAYAIEWMDKESVRLGMGFYQLAFNLMQKKLAENRAKEWLGDKSS